MASGRPSWGTVLLVAAVGAAFAAFVGHYKGLSGLLLVAVVVVVAAVSGFLAAGASERTPRRSQPDAAEDRTRSYTLSYGAAPKQEQPPAEPEQN